MLNFILGFLACYVIISIIHEYWWNHYTMTAVELPAVAFEFLLTLLLEIILFPFVFLWKLFRHCNKPVKSEAIQNLNLWEHSTHLFRNIYFCHDKKAKSLTSKFFFFRILPPVVSDVPDSPKEFRIGG